MSSVDQNMSYAPEVNFTPIQQPVYGDVTQMTPITPQYTPVQPIKEQPYTPVEFTPVNQQPVQQQPVLPEQLPEV